MKSIEAIICSFSNDYETEQELQKKQNKQKARVIAASLHPPEQFGVEAFEKIRPT